MGTVKGIVDGTKSVATAGTAVALVSSATKAYNLTIKAMEDNKGAIFLGPSTISSSSGSLDPGDSLSFQGGVANFLDLANIYIDCATGNTDGVDFWYVDADVEQ